MSCKPAPLQKTAHQKQVEKIEQALAEGTAVVMGIDYAALEARAFAGQIKAAEEERTAAMLAQQIHSETYISSASLLNELRIALVQTERLRDTSRDELAPLEFEHQCKGLRRAIGLVNAEITRELQLPLEFGRR